MGSANTENMLDVSWDAWRGLLDIEYGDNAGYYQPAVDVGLVYFLHEPEDHICIDRTSKGMRYLSRLREVADGLGDEDAVCLQLSAVVPWCDLSGNTTRLGLILSNGKQSPFGRAVLYMREYQQDVYGG